MYCLSLCLLWPCPTTLTNKMCNALACVLTILLQGCCSRDSCTFTHSSSHVGGWRAPGLCSSSLVREAAGPRVVQSSILQLLLWGRRQDAVLCSSLLAPVNNPSVRHCEYTSASWLPVLPATACLFVLGFLFRYLHTFLHT